MNAMNDRTHIVNPDASFHDLMNGATEWLNYAQRLTSFLSEVIDDVDDLQGKEVAMVLMVIEALTQRGLDCAMQAHSQMAREQLHAATSTLARVSMS